MVGKGLSEDEQEGCQKMNDNKLSRRDFIKITVVGATLLTGSQIFRHVQASETIESNGRKWAMVIDQSKCTGCNYCTLACRAHNDIPPEISWNVVTKTGMVGTHDIYIARPCMQCTNAPCVDVCPVKASSYRPDGIVAMDYDRCIGCRYCEIACPYGARSFNWKQFEGPNPAVPEWGQPEVARRPRGVVEKCSFCYQRIDRGLALGLTPGINEDATPACVVACPVGARVFGDLNDPASNVSELLREHVSYRLREDLGTSPHVYYLPAEEPLS
jgi:phenylacetyl-CoA:acceptor oxidoreductase subunit 1